MQFNVIPQDNISAIINCGPSSFSSQKHTQHSSAINMTCKSLLAYPLHVGPSLLFTCSSSGLVSPPHSVSLHKFPHGRQHSFVPPLVYFPRSICSCSRYSSCFILPLLACIWTEEAGLMLHSY